ncbi:hypothetical protein [Magnetospirillum sp. UT-4]|uniref:hypothetical protein n=1 Tax=Magnetospirillum sp. UT-4 TaxID=2681467 RepID=UPI00137CEA48|nr:hypothetical protein [Magnetospirillum sp. UT-4]CAA7624980.1 hypothetical protein MTBUT4_610011 [Magnetospirillum sp. UT-4]
MHINDDPRNLPLGWRVSMIQADNGDWCLVTGRGQEVTYTCRGTDQKSASAEFRAFIAGRDWARGKIPAAADEGGMDSLRWEMQIYALDGVATLLYALNNRETLEKMLELNNGESGLALLSDRIDTATREMWVLHGEYISERHKAKSGEG